MSPQAVKRANVNMKRFEHNEKQLIARIDITKKLNMADENIMDKHYVGKTRNQERVWRF